MIVYSKLLSVDDIPALPQSKITNLTTDLAGKASTSHTHDAGVITFTPSVLADWNSSADPGDVDNALDQIAGRVTTLEGAGGGGMADPTTTDGDMIYRVSSFADQNPSRSGLETIVANPLGTTETVIATLSGAGSTGDVTLVWNFWVSQFQPGNVKEITFRLRRDDLSGAILSTQTQAMTADTGNGHDRQYNNSYVDTSPTTRIYVFTVQSTGTSAIYSDTREFDLTAAGTGPTRLAIGSASQVLKTNSTEDAPEWTSLLPVFTTDVSNPPSDAQLDSAIGTPAAVGSGYAALLDDNGAGANVYIVASDGANWWHVAMTKAV